MRMSSSLYGYDEILKRIVFLFFYKIFRAIFGLFQTIYWAINGTMKELHESQLPENYHRSVHVMNIVWYYSFDKIKQLVREDYILTHNRFESPEFIFKTDEVTLLTINRQGAIFVEAKKGVEVWRSAVYSFIKGGQIDHGVRLLFVPMNHFIRMGEELGDPKHHIVCLFNCARCGSTLFTQLMEMSECCVSLSEPDSLMALSQWYAEEGATPKMKEAFKASMRWLCRSYSNLNQKATVIKFAAAAHRILNLTLELYPESKFLYMYREIEKSSKSFYRLAQELPLLKICVNFSRYHGIFAEIFMNTIGYYGRDFRFKSDDEIDICIFMWAIWTKGYLDRRRSGFPVAAVRYEDLVKTPRFAVEEIIKYCDLPADCVDKAMRGLETDSQRNSPVSQEILGRHKAPELTPRAEQRAIKLLKSYDIPPVISQPILLEGTITCK